MRYVILLLVAVLGSCRSRAGVEGGTGGDSVDVASAFALRRDSTDSLLRTPRLIGDPAVVVFWLRAADTLADSDRASAFDDLRSYTAEVASLLASNDIRLLATRSDTLFVDLPNQQRRTVLLSGLDYPFGYVLIDPGGPERILTGVYAGDDLLDELRAYFDLSDDSDSTTVPPPTT
jgi:hypothetical protein